MRTNILKKQKILNIQFYKVNQKFYQKLILEQNVQGRQPIGNAI